MNCFHCRDQGMIGGCPSCGKTKEFSGNAPVSLTKEVMDSLFIPMYYQQVTWDSRELIREFPELASQRSFKLYLDQLDKVYNIFKSGQIPQKSFMVFAPPRRGKQIWAFSCMKEALQHGYNVVPMLDTSEWRRLNIIATERAYIKDMSLYGCTMEDMVKADVVFLTVDKDNFKGSYRAIESLLDKRQRRGKTTILISRYSPTQISILDFEKDFEKAFDKAQRLNPLKYLGLIQGV